MARRLSSRTGSSLEALRSQLREITIEWNDSVAKFLNNFRAGQTVLESKLEGNLRFEGGQSGSVQSFDCSEIPMVADTSEKRDGGGFFWHKTLKRPLSIKESVQALNVPARIDLERFSRGLFLREEGILQGEYRNLNILAGLLGERTGLTGTLDLNVTAVKDNVELGANIHTLKAGANLAAEVEGRRVTLTYTGVGSQGGGGAGCETIDMNDVFFAQGDPTDEGTLIGLGPGGFIAYAVMPFTTGQEPADFLDVSGDKVPLIDTNGYINMGFLPIVTEGGLDSAGFIVATTPSIDGGRFDASFLPAVSGADITHTAGSTVWTVEALRGLEIPLGEPAADASILYAHTPTPALDFGSRTAASIFDTPASRVAQWDFTSDTYYSDGVTITDLSGNGCNGTTWPAVTKEHHAKGAGRMSPGDICLTSGADSPFGIYVANADVGPISIDAPFTFQAWVLSNRAFTAGRADLCCHHAAAATPWGLRISRVDSPAQQIFEVYYTNGVTDITYNSTIKVPYLEWFLFTYTRALTGENIIYVNTLAEQLAASGDLPDDFSGRFIVGGSNQFSDATMSSGWTGLILAARVLNEVRSPANVAADYQRGVIY